MQRIFFQPHGQSVAIPGIFAPFLRTPAFILHDYRLVSFDDGIITDRHTPARATATAETEEATAKARAEAAAEMLPLRAGVPVVVRCTPPVQAIVRADLPACGAVLVACVHTKRWMRVPRTDVSYAMEGGDDPTVAGLDQLHERCAETKQFDVRGVSYLVPAGFAERTTNKEEEEDVAEEEDKDTSSVLRVHSCEAGEAHLEAGDVVVVFFPSGAQEGTVTDVCGGGIFRIAYRNGNIYCDFMLYTWCFSSVCPKRHTVGSRLFAARTPPPRTFPERKRVQTDFYTGGEPAVKKQLVTD